MKTFQCASELLLNTERKILVKISVKCFLGSILIIFTMHQGFLMILLLSNFEFKIDDSCDRTGQWKMQFYTASNINACL